LLSYGPGWLDEIMLCMFIFVAFMRVVCKLR